MSNELNILVNEINEREKWFIERIGKRVFRNEVSCNCEICNHVTHKGIIIHDEMHASYLMMIESDFTASLMPTRYFDTIEEVKDFIKQIKKNNMYSTDNRKNRIKTDFDYAIDYLKDNGWKFPQGEFAIKGDLRIELDCYPQLISNGEECRDWETLKELKKILTDKTFIK